MSSNVELSLMYFKLLEKYGIQSRKNVQLFLEMLLMDNGKACKGIIIHVLHGKYRYCLIFI